MGKSDWVLDNESRVLTLVKMATIDKLKTSYPKIWYTSEDKANITQYPCVSIKEIGAVESGTTLDSLAVESSLSTVQVKITINTNKSDVKKIARYILDAFKKLQFNSVMLPIFSDAGDLHYCNMRFRRMIGNEDIL